MSSAGTQSECEEIPTTPVSEDADVDNTAVSESTDSVSSEDVSEVAHDDKLTDAASNRLQPNANTYRPPVWAMPCPSDSGYRLEVIKNGVPLPDCTIYLTGTPDAGEGSEKELSFCLVGRQPQPSYAPYNRLHGQCAVLAHPSISRLHAVLQFGRPPLSIAKTSLTQPELPGWYIQDLESTHGTFINKRRLPPGRFVRIHVGHVIRFGGSTRLNLLQGPDEDIEKESAESWTEIKQAHLARLQAKERLAETGSSEGNVDLGCDWGLSAEDASTDIPNFLQDINGAACLSHENLYQDDPKRALKAYFEREGIDPAPEYEFVEATFGKQHCKIELPLPSGTVTAEAIVAGKRKEAIAQCALEACRLLDRLGEFDPNKDHAASSKRVRTKAYWEENDYYSSDEDTFIDRTGQVERKRLVRIRQLGVEGREAEEAARRAAEVTVAAPPCSGKRLDNATLLTVLAELEKVGEEIVFLEEQLDKINKEFTPEGPNPSELDELEAYMNALKSGAPSRKERLKLKSRLFVLRQTESRLFKQAGLPQPRRRPRVTASDESEGTAGNVMRADAAAAVRAAKRKLQQNNETEGSTETAIERSKNARLQRNEIKRTLAGHPSAKQSKTIRISDEDEPFQVEEDEDDEPAVPSKALKSDDNNHTPPLQKSPTCTFDFTDSTFDSKGNLQPSTTIEEQNARLADTSESPEAYNGISEEAEVKAVEGQHAHVTNDDADTSSRSSTSRRVPLGPTLPTKCETASKKTPRAKQPKVDVYQQADPDYVTWVPPTDQKGDGITALNAKYGY